MTIYSRHDEALAYNGMSLRDYFAASALAGVMEVCRDDTAIREGRNPQDHFAIKAYEIADAMLSARGVALSPHDAKGGAA